VVVHEERTVLTAASTNVELATASWVAWYKQDRPFLGLADLLCDVA